MNKTIINKIGLFAIMALFILLNWTSINGYLHFKMDVAHLWILLLPFIVKVDFLGKYSLRLLIPTMIALILQFVLPSYFFIFFFVAFALLLFMEQTLGELNYKSILTILFITPFTKYFFDLLGFPVRVFLTKISGKLLTLFGMKATIVGSQIQKIGESFYVDSSCMGLKMVIVSFLLHIFFVSVFEGQMKKRVKFWPFILSLPFTALLITFTNLIRITILIAFSLYPNTWQHEAVGIACLLFGTILPHYFMAKKLVSSGHDHSFDSPIVSNPKRLPIIITCFTAGLIINLTANGIVDIPKNNALAQFELSSFSSEILKTNVILYQNKNSLIYLKPNKGALRGDHHPFLCWRGEGYAVSQEEVIDFAGEKIYRAMLSKGDNHIYTAWWYDNGIDKTIDQIEWRKRMLLGDPRYILVNVSSYSEEDLFISINQMFNELSPQINMLSQTNSADNVMAKNL